MRPPCFPLVARPMDRPSATLGKQRPSTLAPAVRALEEQGRREASPGLLLLAILPGPAPRASKRLAT
jgi:hypothetical protein